MEHTAQLVPAEVRVPTANCAFRETALATFGESVPR
jgi:hypothetical protein